MTTTTPTMHLVEERAEALRLRTPSLSKAQAVTRIFSESPDLYVKVSEETDAARKAPKFETAADRWDRERIETDRTVWRALREAWKRDRPGEGEAAMLAFAAEHMPGLRSEAALNAELYALSLR